MKPPTIETNHPMPCGNLAVNGKLPTLRRALSAMNPGESFVWQDCKSVYRAAKQIGVEITMRKLNGQGFRVWRRK